MNSFRLNYKLIQLLMPAPFKTHAIFSTFKAIFHFSHHRDKLIFAVRIAVGKPLAADGI
jgi:hypothetical protein